MLVLTRKKNESIVIGGQITITVIAVKGKQIRLGIEAAKEIPVLRAEIADVEASGPEKRGIGAPPSIAERR